MIFYYLDASAWIKRYYYETGTNWVKQLFAENPNLACASLGLIEVMATLARKQKGREIPSSLLNDKAQELNDDWQHFIQIHLTAEVVELAQSSALRLALRGADAIHLASALVLQQHFAESDDRLIFVTSDQELKEAARLSGLTVIDPNEQVEARAPSD